MLKKMYKQFMLHHGHSILAFVLFVGHLSTSVACKGDFYQPKVPDQLLKK